MNRTVLLDVIFDIMKQNDITIKQLTREFFVKRIKNQKYQETFIAGLESELKSIHIVDSKDLHEDLFKDIEQLTNDKTVNR